MQQDRDVAELLRNFVRRHGERRADAERNRRPHRRADDDAVEKIVERVADDHHRRRHAVGFAVVRVAVAPQHQLLEQKKQHDAGEQRAENRPGREIVECFRKQNEQRHAEQRADGVADEPRDELNAKAIVEKEET